MLGILTLRLRLLLLWLFTIAVCVALAYVMRSVYQLGTEAQTEKATALASHACSRLRNEYVRAAKPAAQVPDPVLMGALLNVVLDDAPGVEGGYWHDGRGFVAYAFPTHQGSEPKTDVPSTERGRIESVVRSSFGTEAPKVDAQPGSREAVLVVACSIGPQPAHLGAWTMTRVPVAAGKAYDEVSRGLALLLLFAVGSGLWLSYSFYRWTHHFSGIEKALRGARGEDLAEVPPTGDVELDRIVVALNDFSERLGAARAQAAELGNSLERQERYAALGRMAASVAHEVRNPIAAIRLKAENALIQPERREAALAFVLREVERLDNIVRALLSRAEPIRIHSRDVQVEEWLCSRISAFSDRSASRQVAIRCHTERLSWRFDPDALGRAMDNVIDNALDHTPFGGAIEIHSMTNRTDTALILSVSDTGPGVPAKVRERLFEPFVSGRANGIGLGLALAREILLAHRGDIRYIAQAGGACFELEIPWPAS